LAGIATRCRFTHFRDIKSMSLQSRLLDASPYAGNIHYTTMSSTMAMRIPTLRDMIQIVQDDMDYFTEMRATRRRNIEDIGITAPYNRNKYEIVWVLNFTNPRIAAEKTVGFRSKMIWALFRKTKIFTGKLWHIDPQKIEVVSRVMCMLMATTKKLSGQIRHGTLKRKMSLTVCCIAFALRVAGNMRKSIVRRF